MHAAKRQVLLWLGTGLFCAFAAAFALPVLARADVADNMCYSSTRYDYTCSYPQKKQKDVNGSIVTIFCWKGAPCSQACPSGVSGKVSGTCTKALACGGRSTCSGQAVQLPTKQQEQNVIGGSAGNTIDLAPVHVCASGGEAGTCSNAPVSSAGAGSASPYGSLVPVTNPSAPTQTTSGFGPALVPLQSQPSGENALLQALNPEGATPLGGPSQSVPGTVMPGAFTQTTAGTGFNSVDITNALQDVPAANETVIGGVPANSFTQTALDQSTNAASTFAQNGNSVSFSSCAAAGSCVVVTDPNGNILQMVPGGQPADGSNMVLTVKAPKSYGSDVIAQFGWAASGVDAQTIASKLEAGAVFNTPNGLTNVQLSPQVATQVANALADNYNAQPVWQRLSDAASNVFQPTDPTISLSYTQPPQPQAINVELQPQSATQSPAPEQGVLDQQNQQAQSYLGVSSAQGAQGGIAPDHVPEVQPVLGSSANTGSGAQGVPGAQSGPSVSAPPSPLPEPQIVQQAPPPSAPSSPGPSFAPSPALARSTPAPQPTAPASSQGGGGLSGSLGGIGQLLQPLSSALGFTSLPFSSGAPAYSLPTNAAPSPSPSTVASVDPFAPSTCGTQPPSCAAGLQAQCMFGQWLCANVSQSAPPGSSSSLASNSSGASQTTQVSQATPGASSGATGAQASQNSVTTVRASQSSSAPPATTVGPLTVTGTNTNTGNAATNGGANANANTSASKSAGENTGASQATVASNTSVPPAASPQSGGTGGGAGNTGSGAAGNPGAGIGSSEPQGGTGSQAGSPGASAGAAPAPSAQTNPSSSSAPSPTETQSVPTCSLIGCLAKTALSGLQSALNGTGRVLGGLFGVTSAEASPLSLQVRQANAAQAAYSQLMAQGFRPGNVLLGSPTYAQTWKSAIEATRQQLAAQGMLNPQLDAAVMLALARREQGVPGSVQLSPTGVQGPMQVTSATAYSALGAGGFNTAQGVLSAASFARHDLMGSIITGTIIMNANLNACGGNIACAASMYSGGCSGGDCGYAAKVVQDASVMRQAEAAAGGNPIVAAQDLSGLVGDRTHNGIARSAIASILTGSSAGGALFEGYRGTPGNPTITPGNSGYVTGVTRVASIPGSVSSVATGAASASSAQALEQKVAALQGALSAMEQTNARLSGEFKAAGNAYSSGNIGGALSSANAAIATGHSLAGNLSAIALQTNNARLQSQVAALSAEIPQSAMSLSKPIVTKILADTNAAVSAARASTNASIGALQQQEQQQQQQAQAASATKTKGAQQFYYQDPQTGVKGQCAAGMSQTDCMKAGQQDVGIERVAQALKGEGKSLPAGAQYATFTATRNAQGTYVIADASGKTLAQNVSLPSSACSTGACSVQLLSDGSGAPLGQDAQPLKSGGSPLSSSLPSVSADASNPQQLDFTDNRPAPPPAPPAAQNPWRPGIGAYTYRGSAGMVFPRNTYCMTSAQPTIIIPVPAGTPFPSNCYNNPLLQPASAMGGLPPMMPPQAYPPISSQPLPQPLPSPSISMPYAPTLACVPVSVQSGQQMQVDVHWACSSGTASSTGFVSGNQAGNTTVSITASSSPLALSLSCVSAQAAGPTAECSVAASIPPSAPSAGVGAVAVPAAITPGTPVQLSWTSANMASCVVTDQSGAQVAQGTNGSVTTPPLNGAESFTFACTGSSGGATTTVAVSAQ